MKNKRSFTPLEVCSYDIHSFETKKYIIALLSYLRGREKIFKNEKFFHQRLLTKRSFTLIELLVVIVIVAVLAAVAIPTVVGVVNRARDAAIKSDMRTLHSIALEIKVAQDVFNRSGHAVSCDPATGHPGVRAICERIRGNSPHPAQVRYFVGPDHFCIQAPLHNGRFWRIDHTDFLGEDICGYVARWNMNENPAIHGTRIHDTTGVNHGTLSTNDGATNKASAGALRFDGVNDFVNVPHSASLDIINEITLEAWVNPVILADVTGYNSVVTRFGSPSFGYELYVMNSGAAILYIRGATTDFIAGGSVLLNRWSYIAGVYSRSAGTMAIYVNGVLVGSKTTTVVLGGGIRDVFIGERGAGGGLRFNGLIDEVRIYNRALTAEEIAASFRRGR